MRGTRTLGIVLGLAVAMPALAAEPGSVTPPAAAPLVDATSGESWNPVAPSAPAVFTLTGPARFQVGFRMNLPADPAQAVPAGIVQVRYGGRPLSQFRMMARPGRDTWKAQTDFKPSAAVGFLVEVAPGDHTYEFRLNGGGAHGGAIRVIDASKSARPLPARAPVVAIPAAAKVAAAPTPAPEATPTPGTVATPGPTPPSPPPGRDQPSARDGARTLALFIGASQSAQARSFVPGSAPASDLRVGARWLAIRSAELSLAATFESSEDVIPTPAASARRITEKRVLVDAGAGYRMAGARGSLVVGPALHFASFDNDVARYDWMTAGAGVRVEAPAGRLTAFAGGDAGLPIADGTPTLWTDGALELRAAWSIGARYPLAMLPGSPSLAIEYRGELVDREYSELVSHGAGFLLQVDL